MLGLTGIAFTAPWILAGLIVVPAIWWLLRVTPPAPRRVVFPPVRILRSLQAEEETPARTPLWLTILRMVLATLAVLALAQPLINPRGELAGRGPVLVVVDNGWASAQDWAARQQAIDDLLTQAERSARPVALLATAPPADGGRPAPSDLMPADRARDLARAWQPQPWPTHRADAFAAIDREALGNDPAVIWFSDGLADGTLDDPADALLAIGDLTIREPTAVPTLALRPPEAGGSLEMTVLRAEAGPEQAVWIRVSADRGRLLGRNQAVFAGGDTATTVLADLPPDIRNDAERIEIEGVNAAAGLVLLDERWRRRAVGLVSGASLEERSQPLLSGLHYLERALSPFADVRRGTVTELLQRPLSVMMLADIGRLSPREADALSAWVDDGGMLVRFAGPKLAEHADELIPVELRSGGRALGGALSWSKPARLAPFSETSPFFGLDVPEDVVVRRQVLAQPALDLDARTWARLADGTPLVTGAERGRGQLILFHTTANADWSNLVLSGLFVDLMRRVVKLARGVSGSGSDQMLPPLQALDGFGQLGDPGLAAEPVAANDIDQSVAGPRTPPGFYGSSDGRRAINLTQTFDALTLLPSPPATAARAELTTPREVDLKPWLLTVAVILALVDLLATLTLRGLLRGRQATTAAVLLAAGAAVGWPANDAMAQSQDAFALAATEETRLAYVLTGQSDIDELSRAGLAGLSEILARRTSIEPGPPMGVDLEKDVVVFFPLLYWPISTAQRDLSPDALTKLAEYMRTGGTVLFDTRDAGLVPRGFSRGGGRSANTARLQQMLQRLDIAALVPVPQDHVLTKAFYLMQAFPGRYAGGNVWVELRPGGSNDGVSSIIIGSNDYAAAWATDATGRPVAAVIPGGERQREMAYRFGVNLVMYTLTGNYKADQVHVPSILERLGQ